MQACKVGSSETHNLREKQLSYVVPEMSHLNESVIHEHIPEALARIEATYTEVTGQRIWNWVKDFEAPREDLGQKNGRGMKI